MIKNGDLQTESVAEAIRARSVKRPQRVVVDEVFPDGSARLLIADSKSRKKEPDLLDHSIWHEEEEYKLGPEELGKLLSEKQLHEISEGKVFRLQSKRAKNIHRKVKSHIKVSTKELLTFENKPRDERRR